MLRPTSRSARSVLTLTLLGLGACADEPTTPGSPTISRPNANVGDVLTVTNTRGGKDVGSLRWAVAQVTGGEIIRFDARLAGSTITLDSTLVIPNAITIEGPADKGITISGGGKGRVIDVRHSVGSDTPTKLRNLSITGGKLPIEGGAGIRTVSPLVVEHSTIWGNESSSGAAILAIDYGILTLTNSTVSGNTTTLGGYSTIMAFNAVTINNSTIAYNVGGGVRFSEYEQGRLNNSIVAYNGIGNCRVLDLLTLQGVNISNDFSCGDSTTMLIADPKLASLRDNGGPSPTHALTAESPAFNAMGPCGIAVDQRYTPRDGSCDVGAFESTDFTTVTLALDRVSSVNALGTSASVGGTLQCTRTDFQPLTLSVRVQQKRPDKTVVEGYGQVNVYCSTASQQQWTATVVPSGGTFKSGNAATTATVLNGPVWATRATTSRSIKLAD